MATSDVATSLRIPADWLARADILATQLSAVSDSAAVFQGNPSRSAALRFAIFRGLAALEAQVSLDGYGPWTELDGVHARYNAAGVWFVRIVTRADSFDVASNRGGVVHSEGQENTIESAKWCGDQALAQLSACGIEPAVLGTRTPVAERVEGPYVTLRLHDKVAQILEEIDDASDYVGGLLLRHEAEWKAAWDDLRQSGWTRVEIGVAVERLCERWLVNDMRGWQFYKAVPEVLADSEKYAVSADVHPSRWVELVAATRDEHFANHLLVLSREVALGNTRAESRIISTTRLSWGRRRLEGSVVDVSIDPDDPARDTARGRIEALGPNDPVSIDRAPTLLHDDTLLVSLTLKVPDTDRRRIARLVTATLGLPSARWCT